MSLPVFKKITLFAVIIGFASLLIGAGFSVAQEEQSEQEINNEKIEQLKKEIEENEKALEELRKEAKEQQQNLQETKAYANSLSGQINQFNRDIRQLEAQIRIKEQEILSTQLAIKRINLEIEEMENKIEVVKAQITALIQEIYKSDKESVVELVFKYDEFSEFFNQIQARKSIQEAVQEALEEIKKLKEGLEESRIVLEEKEERFEEDRAVLRDQKIIIERERLRRNQLLRQTKEEEAEYKGLLNEIEEQQEETQRQIFELEEQLRQEIDPNSIPTAGTTVFGWPAEGILTQGYGCTSFARSSKYYPTCFHNGIDVASSSGTPIYAAADGVVLHMDYTPTAYGYWITIKHNNGFITMYGHLSLQKVRPGQSVKRGDLIGYMGSTGMSTGPHLHFTVFTAQDYFLKPSKYSGMIPIGATVNPFDYLP